MHPYKSILNFEKFLNVQVNMTFVKQFECPSKFSSLLNEILVKNKKKQFSDFFLTFPTKKNKLTLKIKEYIF